MGTGFYDSSKIRVEPVFTRVIRHERGPHEFLKWVARRFANRIPNDCIDEKSIDVYFSGQGGGELAIPPNPDLIDYLLTDEGIELLCKDRKDKLSKKTSTHSELNETELARLRLFDTRTREVQRKRARIGGRMIKAFLFEGLDYPDVVFTNEKMVLIIEGKLTEPRFTTRTTWLDCRDQMIRHLDSAMACKQFSGKSVFGMYVVGDESRDESIKQSGRHPHYDWACYDNIEYWASSMPQYSADKDRVRKVMDGFLGHVTWHEIGKVFGGIDVPVSLGSGKTMRLI